MSGPEPSTGAPVVIVGTGAAGLSAALMLAGRRPVVLVTKGSLGDGATAWAQGGLAAVIAPTDSVLAHAEDTMVAGAGLCDERAVGELVASAPEAIERLVALGARFDRDDSGELALGLEGGHSARRIVHAGGDASGAEVARTLAAAVRRAVDAGAVRLLERTWAIDAMLDSAGAVCGVRLMGADGAVWDIAASALVLATGGIGQLWSSTTNPSSATGDGLALAARSGAVLRDVEFMQFHPTLLAVGGGRGVLVTEALRGEGAVLRDRTGARVMAGVHPLADLAPRDVVSAAMHEHMLRTGETRLFLDGTELGAEAWRAHFPTVLGMCRERGVDPVVEPIPVRPGAHYHCGGVAADLSGRTSVPGLLAIGEVACTGVQGANRLASNSVTEALVAGQRCGQLLRGSSAWASSQAVLSNAVLSRAVPATRGLDRSQLVAAASAYAGVSRDADGLATFSALLAEVKDGVAIGSPDELEEANLTVVARLLAAAATARTESRGCHRRSDYPRADPAWGRRIDVRLSGDAGRVVVAGEPVVAA